MSQVYLQFAATLACGLSLVVAFPSNRYRIPNGFRVPCPEGASWCQDGICRGVAHTSCYGSTKELNSFGEDMKKAGHKWTKELCEKDSDGDGLTNGEELGDPCCLFSAWDVPSKYTADFLPSHPGYANSKVANYQRPSCDSTMPKKKAPEMGKFNPGEVQKVADILVKNFTIPFPGSVSKRTTYVDIAWNFDDESHDIFHVVRADGIVNTPKNLHHYVVRACEGKFPEEKNGKPISSREKGAKCNRQFGGWVPGRPIEELPPWSGVAIGKGAGIQSFVVNIHYDNPDHESGIVAQDGMRLYYTPTLRNDSLTFFSTLQVSNNPTMMIPPRKPRYFMTRGCDLEVTDYDGNPKEAQLLRLGFHAHLIGTEMYAERIRGEDRLTLAADPIWYFDDQYQKNVYLDNITLKTGDQLQTTCVFNSNSRTQSTVIGIETTDEMCWGTFHLATGGLRVQCRGPIWTGELGANEPALGLEKLHTTGNADGVWTGTNLRTGGDVINSRADLQVCSDLNQFKHHCETIAGMQGDNATVCDMTYSEMGLTMKRIAGLRPLHTCCTAFCKTVCPNHCSCGGQCATTTTAAPTSADAATSADAMQETSQATCNSVAFGIVGLLITLAPARN